MYDPDVFIYKNVLMQRLSDYVRYGYRFWTSGEVNLNRVTALTDKFARYYQVDLDRNRRARLKAKGEGCAVLLIWRHDESTCTWFLLVTPGEHPAHRLEKLKDAISGAGRLTITGYELVQQTRKGQDHPSWTWRMTHDTYESWRVRVIQLARSHSRKDAVQDLFWSLYRTPGFAGTRHQVGKIVALLRREWRRSRSASEIFPPLPKLGYVQRLKNSTVKLSKLVRKSAHKPVLY